MPFYDLLYSLSRKLWPQLESFSEPNRSVGVGEVFASLYGALLSVIGLTWLVFQTSPIVFTDSLATLALLFILLVIFEQLSFFMIVELYADNYGSTDDSLHSMVIWAGLFILGPTMLWLPIGLQLVKFIREWRSANRAASRWNRVRNLALYTATTTTPYLLGLAVYRAIGGSIPLANLEVLNIFQSMIGIGVSFLVALLIWSPYIAYTVTMQKRFAGAESGPVLRFILVALVLPALAQPFAILASSLYVGYGLWVFLFYMSGLILVAYLARQFSRSAEHSRQQSRQLEKLEKLGRALLNAPPDASTLPEILSEHIPGMFPSGNIVIWLSPNEILYQAPEGWTIDIETVSETAFVLGEARAYLFNEPLPWDPNDGNHNAIILAPISAEEGARVIGGIYMELHSLIGPWSLSALARLFPAVHTLTDQIASAIDQAEDYAQTLAYQGMAQELRLAGQIQASFLPSEFPNVPGWQLAVTLEPARGLSGDFFDLIPLPSGRLGILIADVADKGFGAALYMALSRTLLRTYAIEYPLRPDLVFSEANERILSDASANLFITVFYGILDPEKDTLTYCNAGHNPPLHLSNKQGGSAALIRTGMPIGIDEDALWDRKVITFDPGDTLVLYTDGIPDAQNESGEFFDEDQLVAVAEANKGASAYEMQDAILKRVRGFVNGAPQFDDITLMVLARDN